MIIMKFRCVHITGKNAISNARILINAILANQSSVDANLPISVLRLIQFRRLHIAANELS
jgi:hypothetical protein